MAEGPLLLVFDGSCPFCTRLARLAVERAGGRISALPSQAPGLLAAHGLSREDADRSVWTIAPSGGRWRGAAAVARVLDEMGGAWRALAALVRAPGAELAYRAVARTRGRLSAIWGDPPPYPS